MGFSSMWVFMAGATSLGQVAANVTVVSMSSAWPWANLAITLAVAGAMSIKSAALARLIWATSYWKLRSNVSTWQRRRVSVSNTSGEINSVAFFVIRTCTSAPSLTSACATLGIL